MSIQCERSSSERWNCGRECWTVILSKCRLPHYILGIFCMPQICDMGPMALLPLRRKACWGFFCPEKSWHLWPGLNPRTWVLKGSTLLLDCRSHLTCPVTQFHIPEDWKLQHHCCENVKPYEVLAIETSLHERSRDWAQFCTVNADSSCSWCDICCMVKE